MSLDWFPLQIQNFRVTRLKTVKDCNIALCKMSKTSGTDAAKSCKHQSRIDGEYDHKFYYKDSDSTEVLFMVQEESQVTIFSKLDDEEPWYIFKPTANLMVLIGMSHAISLYIIQ